MIRGQPPVQGQRQNYIICQGPAVRPGMRQVATPGLGGQQLQGAVQIIGGKRGMNNNLYSAHGHKEAEMSRQQSAVMQQTAVTTVRTALQVPRPISLQSRNDHQNHPFVQNNAVMSTTSATETFDANDFITEFNILQGKKKPKVITSYSDISCLRCFKA